MASKLGTTLPTLDVALLTSNEQHWNNTANTVEGHFFKKMHKDTYEARQRREDSYFDS